MAKITLNQAKEILTNLKKGAIYTLSYEVDGQRYHKPAKITYGNGYVYFEHCGQYASKATVERFQSTANNVLLKDDDPTTNLIEAEYLTDKDDCWIIVPKDHSVHSYVVKHYQNMETGEVVFSRPEADKWIAEGIKVEAKTIYDEDYTSFYIDRTWKLN